MIKLEKVNKYFNRHKKNQIHVINDTSLEISNTGLVALLGPSGSGKTTLLNVIGGLDKINNGNIYIDGQKLSHKISYKNDRLRVLNIGYIFQDYHLLENLSVFENVAISLKMIGIKNKREIKKRVDYVLNQVGLYRYRNKPAGMLSGGEKQRVGIARAIVKNPKIIIADEPTGNLDSKNTIEIMNIIKSISMDKLVILVTHEKDLAYFYASRIITLEDGKIISDNINEHENELDYKIDNKFYLKDFKNHEKIKQNFCSVDIYSDNDEKLNIKIVIKNGNIYIKSEESKIEVVDEASSIELIDEHYKKINKRDYEKSNFDPKILENKEQKTHYASIYNIFTMIKVGIKKVFSYTFMKKILLLGFFLSAMFIVYALSNIFGVTNIKDSAFIKENKNYIRINNRENDCEKYLSLEKEDYIGYMIPGTSNIRMKILKRDIYQFMNTEAYISGSLSSINLLSGENIILGRRPQNDYEIVIDKSITKFDDTYSSQETQMLGIKDYSDYLNLKLEIQNMPEFTIVGISDTDSPSIYMNEKLFINVIANKDLNEEIKIIDYRLMNENIKLKKGRLPQNDYEVIISSDEMDFIELNKTIDFEINGKKLKVVGFYTPIKSTDTHYYVNNNTIKYLNIINNPNVTIYSKDKEKALSKLREKNYNAFIIYDADKEEYIEEIKLSTLGSIIIAGILLFISFIEIYLMIRASFMSRIKEIGIYRAIGVKKRDIYKMFLGEILVITTIAGLPGYVLMAAIIKEISKINYLNSYFTYNGTVLILSLVLIYELNILIGLLPIKRVIRKTPAQILSRNDVD